MKSSVRVLLAMFITHTTNGCTAAPSHEGAGSAHFDGERFYNTQRMDKGSGDMFKLGWGAMFEAESWPSWVEIQPQSVPHERVTEGISVTFINHASFLVQVDGLNILTDPIYSDRASPYQWAGPKRVHAPGVRLEDLPPIDVVLVSHNHYDHLDEATLQRLAAQQEQQPLVLSGLGNGKLFQQLGLDDFRDLDWNEKYALGGVEFVFSECRHRSGRGFGDQMETLWGAFVIKTGAGNIYFAGDTGYGAHFKNTGDQYGPFALALLPIGAYEPRWFMRDVHVNPAEAVQAHFDLRSEHSLGMHFGTFQLSYEAREQPVLELREALSKRGLDEEDFSVLPVGLTRVFRSAKARR
ncbi:MAG: MBL fold metallo-hydrolase [Gammaproteobacteria bacterium]|nr:MBL fold metallo-hydrolase [Gammaproteobacteria bacterium]